MAVTTQTLWLSISISLSSLALGAFYCLHTRTTTRCPHDDGNDLLTQVARRTHGFYFHVAASIVFIIVLFIFCFQSLRFVQFIRLHRVSGRVCVCVCLNIVVCWCEWRDGCKTLQWHKGKLLDTALLHKTHDENNLTHIIFRLRLREFVMRTASTVD